MTLQGCSPGFSVLSTKEPLRYCKPAGQQDSNEWKVTSAEDNVQCTIMSSMST